MLSVAQVGPGGGIVVCSHLSGGRLGRWSGRRAGRPHRRWEDSLPIGGCLLVGGGLTSHQGGCEGAHSGGHCKEELAISDAATDSYRSTALRATLAGTCPLRGSGPISGAGLSEAGIRLFLLSSFFRPAAAIECWLAGANIDPGDATARHIRADRLPRARPSVRLMRANLKTPSRPLR